MPSMHTFVDYSLAEACVVIFPCHCSLSLFSTLVSLAKKAQTISRSPPNPKTLMSWRFLFLSWLLHFSKDIPSLWDQFKNRTTCSFKDSWSNAFQEIIRLWDMILFLTKQDPDIQGAQTKRLREVINPHKSSAPSIWLLFNHYCVYKRNKPRNRKWKTLNDITSFLFCFLKLVRMTSWNTLVKVMNWAKFLPYLSIIIQLSIYILC